MSVYSYALEETMYMIHLCHDWKISQNHSSLYTLMDIVYADESLSDYFNKYHIYRGMVLDIPQYDTYYSEYCSYSLEKDVAMIFACVSDECLEDINSTSFIYHKKDYGFNIDGYICDLMIHLKQQLKDDVKLSEFNLIIDQLNNSSGEKEIISNFDINCVESLY